MYFTYNNITIYYEKYGNSNKSIIILPGWGNTRETFNYLINYLKHYVSIYILDYPGFGKSKFPNKDLDLFDYSNLIYEWIKHLEVDNPILIGHSFGGRIITLLTGYYKYRFNNIIYIDSAGIKHIKFKNYVYKFLKKLHIFIPKKYKKRYLNFLLNKFSSPDYKDINQNMKNTFKNIINLDLKPYLNDIDSKKVLLIWGNKDIDTPLSDSKIMNKKIKNSELVILNNATHFSYLEYPYLISKIIYEQIKDEI